MELPDLALFDDQVVSGGLHDAVSVLHDPSIVCIRPDPTRPLRATPRTVAALRALPTVTVLVASPSTVDDTIAAAFDVCLTDRAEPDRPWVSPGDLGRDGLDEVVRSLERSVADHPFAALALVALLRDPRPDPLAGLAAESAAYALLLGSADFAGWHARTPRSAPQCDPEPLTVVDADTTRHLTFRRADCRNAIDSVLRDRLVEALTQLRGALPGDLGHIERVVLSGEGPAFCAGGDLREFGTVGDPATAHAVRLTRHPAAAIFRSAVPVTALVHGACVGAGLELAAACDRIVATTDARFWLPELTFGLVPGAGGTVSVPRRIGAARTAAVVLSGATLDAATACRWGLIDDVVDALDDVGVDSLPARSRRPVDPFL